MRCDHKGLRADGGWNSRWVQVREKIQAGGRRTTRLARPFSPKTRRYAKPIAKITAKSRVITRPAIVKTTTIAIAAARIATPIRASIARRTKPRGRAGGPAVQTTTGLSCRSGIPGIVLAGAEGK